MFLRSLAIFAVLLLSNLPTLIAQGGGGKSPVTRSLRPILIDLVIEGNSTVSDVDILARIRSRATNRSNLDRYARIALPLSTRLAIFLKQKAGEESEFRYLNTSTVQEDKKAILALYKERGFHLAEVRAQYTVDTARNIGRLQYSIVEGSRAKVWGVRFDGLNNIPAELRTKIEDLQFLKSGSPFDVLNVDQELRRALTILRNNGYADAGERIPPKILFCSPPRCEEPQDSVLIFITPGLRYRFGTTTITHIPVDTTGASPPVEESIIQSRLRYKPGEWYNQSTVDDSKRDLYRLLIFDLVSINKGAQSRVGDTLNMEITYTLNDSREIEGSLELSLSDRTDETVFAGGVAGRTTFKNILRRAIRGSVGGRFQTRLFAFDEIEFGVDGRLDVPVPQILPVDVLSIYANVGRGVEDRVNGVNLNSRRYAFGIDGGWHLPSSSIVTAISARTLYQSNSYTNVEEYIRAKAVSRLSEVVLPDTCDTEALVDQIIPALARDIYRVQVLQGDSPDLKPNQDAREKGSALENTFILGLTALGDHRNNIFSPTEGYYLEGRFDVGLTGDFAGGFVKFELDYRRFLPGSKGSVWAFRVHGGAIGQFGGFPLTPIDSRFHAGGANSVRGWGGREMLVTTPPAEFAGTCADTILREVLNESRRLLGGLWLIEGSVEYRLRLNEVLVLVPFVDVGNAYFRNYSDDKDLVTFNTFVENLGLATGLNLGIETPAGPIRLGAGFPVYNPLDYQGADRWFWRHPLSLAFQLSIGYAF
ncbi:MAG: BamA/TamA family outer membrane protein [Ignavibacteriae bacterium]|nr:BamA/TamA family outer membrane protein [Ignavibacteriota bacterium]MCB9215924.1 BamA/TamA family outer membrane protein [Ignavibacteria bacterium]